MKTKTFAKKQSFISWINSHIVVILMPALLLAFNRFWYLLARLITHTTFKDGGSFFEWRLPIDGEIPFVGFFVLPYILSFFYWLVIPFVIYAIMGKKTFYRFVAATFIAEFIGFIWLILLPAKMTYSDYIARDNYKDAPLYSLMNNMVFKNDLPDNLCPSFHVTATFLPFIAMTGLNSKNKRNIWMILGGGIAFILVALATLFVRQHYVVDVFAGMLIVSIAYLMVRIWKWDTFFEKTNDWWITKMHAIFPKWPGIADGQKIVQSQRSNKVRITFNVSFICASVLVFGLLLYFSLISFGTGDPFQGLWRFGIDNLWPGHQIA